MNSLTQTQTPNNSQAPSSPVETLSTSLIISGLPSNTFTLERFSKDNTDYVFITSDFNTDENAFILARWIWLVSYDSRFLSTIHNGSAGYAVSVDKISELTDRFQNISCEISAAVQTYFADHNMDPRHITVHTDGDYITTPETEHTVTITREVPDTLPDETLELSTDSWNTARATEEFTVIDEHTLETTVDALRSCLSAYFTAIHDDCWENQHHQDRWSL